jgi:hypothetical protein
MRFGYRFISLIWTPVLIAVIHFHYRYLPIYPSYNTQLAITSSSYLVFSFIVAYTAMLATQQRLIYARVRQMAFLDPVVHMPNLRALSRALNGASWSTLCFLRIPELELLGRHYGCCCVFSISKCWRITCVRCCSRTKRYIILPVTI